MDDPNKLHHVFGNPNHNLEPLVQNYGSKETAFRAMLDEVNKTHQDGKLVADACNHYKQEFDVGGYSVIVEGRIVNGDACIGTAWIPPHPWGWSIVLPELKRASRRLVDSVFLPLGRGG
jgi:hypothetical protein